ncbi:MAG: DNA polymerase III, subunit gamma and tau [Candidatus Sungbacteria bacterium RIFCSPLOWO2_02_FULL_48_13b]|uniref:DNA polymerase III subunit gamma/tau n=2 Tax=Candidatus Sungiibacteriota TaxID=1817917 RepID=A0A1G2LI93_9BACT|nr:MAG: DNA polymerase III, subunit gamma and tau [Candidatus Sungbacteria bacterium RIFCSPHIGHO2_02_FULL_49_20]OHA11330.1 MAG: DNA polymerase III, subunit gamma and tau [Candidatus Sungbacteria bacterium RIFCSPLOWO2_02_FULL_48_13b]
MQDHLVLYRKYRPKSFEEIVGQDAVVRALSNALASGRLAHAYLFSGPRGVGKTTIARLIAKAANCANAGAKGPTPCNICESCKRYNEGAAFDVIEIDAASNRGIDEIRELREAIRYAAAHGGRKIYIIDEVHMLTPPAFNALLKSLEEPPEHVIFVLATTEIEKVPATIVSRTQHFEFRRPAVEAIAGRLTEIAKKEGTTLVPQAAHAIALVSEGSFRDAESILGQILAVEDKKITEEEVESVLGLPRRAILFQFYRSLVNKDGAASLAAVGKVGEDGHDMAQFLRSALRLSRLGLFLKLDPVLASVAGKELSPDDEKELRGLVATAVPDHLKKIFMLLADTLEKTKYSPLPELPIQLAILALTVPDN